MPPKTFKPVDPFLPDVMGPSGLLARISLVMHMQGLDLETIGNVFAEDGRSIKIKRHIGFLDLELEEIEALKRWFMSVTEQADTVALHFLISDRTNTTLMPFNMDRDNGQGGRLFSEKSITCEDITVFGSATAIGQLGLAETVASSNDLETTLAEEIVFLF